MVDGVAEYKEKIAVKDQKQSSNCTVCGLDRDTLDGCARHTDGLGREGGLSGACAWPSLVHSTTRSLVGAGRAMGL